MTTWVDLTSEDISNAAKGNVEGNNMLPFSFALAIEAAVKLKNKHLEDNKWRLAIDDELICCHIGVANPEDNPKEKLLQIINWHCACALDPLISSDAEALVLRGQKEAIDFNNDKLKAYGLELGLHYENKLTLNDLINGHRTLRSINNSVFQCLRDQEDEINQLKQKIAELQNTNNLN